jgi:hypothetical protein
MGRSFRSENYCGKPFGPNNRFFILLEPAVLVERFNSNFTYYCIVVGHHVVVTEQTTMNSQSILFSVSNDQCRLSRDTIKGILDKAATLKCDF